MNDKKLAEFLAEKFVKQKVEEAERRGETFTATQISVACETYYYALRRWLQQPADQFREATKMMEEGG